MMTHDQAERLIERLADGYVSFGNRERTAAEVDAFHKDIMNTSPIMLTDVLEKLIKVRYDRLKLVRLWEDCGSTKSLQTILQEAEDECAVCASQNHSRDDMPPYERILKGPAAELFAFLSYLFPET